MSKEPYFAIESLSSQGLKSCGNNINIYKIVGLESEYEF